MAVSKKQITLKKRSKKVSKKTNKKSVKKKVRRTPKKPRALDLRKFIHNPVITPASGSYWESEAVFNPGAVRHGGRVHLFYRALGPDGISRILLRQDCRTIRDSISPAADGAGAKIHELQKSIVVFI